MLADGSPARIPLATPLTRENWRAAWDARKPDRRRRRSTSEFAALPATCRDCGEPLANRRVRYCETCRRSRFAAQADQARLNAARTLDQLRAEQQDPAHGGTAAAARGAKNAAHQAAVRAWTGDAPPLTPDLLAQLRTRPLRQLVAETGLSAAYLSRIRLGKVTPHPRWNETLRQAAQQTDGFSHAARPAT